MDSLTNSVTEGTITTDFPGVIELLAKNLYQQDDMFVRELLQNAHDSIIRRQSTGSPPPGRIDINCDPVACTLTFEDNGSGMTKAEIQDYLSTIGRSGTRELRTQLEQRDRQLAESLIGRFGIGILSAFVVAKRVEVRTCSTADGSPAFIWRSDGSQRYLLEELDRDKPGTVVTVHLKPEYRGMVAPELVAEAVRNYADFLPFPIYVNGQGPINTMNAPWHRSYGNDQERQATYWEWVQKRFPDIPLEVIPVHMETPHPVRGVLYISDRQLPDINMAGMVDIYQARMFICKGDRNLLPLWAKFVRGVIDSPALKPTAARDAIQQDVVHDEIRRSLGVLIIDTLKNLARRNRQRFRRLMEWHHYHIKGMALQFDDFFDAIADTVLFEVSLPEGHHKQNAARDRHPFAMLTLPEYMDLQTEEETTEDGLTRKVIYYISEQGAAPQFYRLCQARKILAINAGLIFEEEFLKKCCARNPEKAVLRRVDIAEGGVIFEKLSESERQRFADLEYNLSKILGEALSGQETIARTEKFAPSDIPAVLTQTADAEILRRLEHLADLRLMSSDLSEAVQEVLGIQRSRAKPVVLHLNATNPLVEQLSREDLGDPVIKDALLSLYNNAFLYSRHYLSVENLEALHSHALKSLAHILEMRQGQRTLLDRISRLAHLRALSAGTQEQDGSHVTVWAMLSHEPDSDVIEEALRQVLEDDPYYFELVRSECAPTGTNAAGNIEQRLTRADSLLADITSLRPDVMFALGLARADAPARPVVILHRQGGEETSWALDGDSFMQYELPSVAAPLEASTLATDFREALKLNQAFEELQEKRAARYLSATYIRRRDQRRILTPAEAETISREFRTIEEFAKADISEIQLRTGLDQTVSALVRHYILGEDESP